MLELANVNFIELEYDHLYNLTKNELHHLHFVDDI